MTTLHNAFLGSLAADALAMPGHWYYDRNALRRDYGVLDRYYPPKNPHPDSILWRSSFRPANERGDILREQSQYWGQPGIHYHQFLEAGENTVNLRLATELHTFVREQRAYEPEGWLKRYLRCMQSWLSLRPQVWTDYLSSLEQLRHAPEFEEARRRAAVCQAGESRIDLMNHFAHELVETGYLPNHARMW